MKTCFLFCLYFSFIGCAPGRKTTDEANSLKKDTKVNPVIVLDTTLQVLRTVTPFNGEVYYKAGWKDRNGENIFILSQSNIYNDGLGRAEIYGYRYVKNGTNWKLNWSSFDFVDGAGCDLSIDIPRAYINITDTDQNEIAEIAYIYTLDNRCDAVVVPTKMIIGIDKGTYFISGFSKLSLGPSEEIMNQFLREQGQPEVTFKATSKNWNTLDKSLQNYYSQIWDKYVAME